MSLLKDLVQVSIHNRNVSTLNQALTIVFPDIVKDKEFIIHEYDGDVPRLFGTDNTIELMLPNDMDTVVENAVVDAIATGTLFDDANTVKNTCDYIAMTQLPMTGMTNRGFDRPAVLKYSMGPVVGAMNHEGRFGTDETDIQNGINFTKDVIDHGNDDNINDLIGSYIDAKDSGKLSLKFRKATRGIDNEIKNINSVEPSDTLTVNDIDDGFGDGESKAKDIDDDDFESKNDNIEDIDECGECGDVDTFDEDGDWASNIMSEVKKQTASKDAELDDIIAKNKQDQDDMQKRVAEMRARVMARRNGNASSWAEETGEIESGESDTTPTESLSTMTEYAIFNEFGININELNELYQELDLVYASMDPNEMKYYMETGQASDANKESKLESTWEKIKQWFRRTFLIIISNFEKMEINNRTKSINKAIDANKAIGVLKDMPCAPLKDAEFNRLTEAWKFLSMDNASNDANKIKQHTQVLKEICDKYKSCIEQQKTFLKNAPNNYTIYTKSSNSVIRTILATNQASIENESKIISAGIKAFKAWNKQNRKNEEFDERLWREYFEYFIKSITSITTELKYYMRSIVVFSDEDIEEMKKRGKLVGDVNESYVDDVYDEYIQEGLFKRPKKLKPIPRDVVAYITVEINAIKDSNDQAMLASYTCAKLELVDFYITCIDTKDERYIVPHTRQYLVQMQTDLNRLLTRILQIKPINHNDRMWKAILTPGGVY